MKRLLNKMSDYGKIIRIGITFQILHQLETETSAQSHLEGMVERDWFKLAMATADGFMVPWQAPFLISAESQLRAEELGEELLDRDPDLRCAVVLCLRTEATLRAATGDPRFIEPVSKAIELMRSRWELPPDAPSPAIMRGLARAYAKYIPGSYPMTVGGKTLKSIRRQSG